MSALRNKQKLGKEERQKQRFPLFRAMLANELLQRDAAPVAVLGENERSRFGAAPLSMTLGRQRVHQHRDQQAS